MDTTSNPEPELFRLRAEVETVPDAGDTCGCCGRYGELFLRVTATGERSGAVKRFALWLCPACNHADGIAEAYSAGAVFEKPEKVLALPGLPD